MKIYAQHFGKRVALTIVILLNLGTVSSSSAAQLGDPESFYSLEVHGFVSQGFFISGGNNYLDKSKDGSFEFTEIGINFTKPLTDRLRVGMQLFARDLGTLGDYRVNFDWFYLDYRVSDVFGMRFGRIKLPFGLYNEVNDIDQARVPVLLPQSIYPLRNRDFLLAQTGGELYGNLKLGNAGILEYRLYSGSIFFDVPSSSNSGVQNSGVHTPYLAGGRLMWDSPVTGLRLGGSAQALKLESTLSGDTLPAPVDIEIPAVLWVASLEYTRDKWLIAAEYGRWHVKSRSNNQTVFPDTNVASERAYALLAYRFLDWLQPGIYHSVLYSDVDNRDGRDGKLMNTAATLRFDINEYWLVKLEGHYMHGTAGLSSTLNDGRPASTLQRNWGVMFIKTTAYF